MNLCHEISDFINSSHISRLYTDMRILEWDIDKYEMRIEKIAKRYENDSVLQKCVHTQNTSKYRSKISECRVQIAILRKDMKSIYQSMHTDHYKKELAEMMPYLAST